MLLQRIDAVGKLSQVCNRQFRLLLGQFKLSFKAVSCEATVQCELF